MKKGLLLISAVLLFFCSKESYSQVNPNPLISVGKPIYASPSLNKDRLVNGEWNDGWNQNWVSENGAWAAINVGAGPDKLMLNFNNYHYVWSTSILNFCQFHPDYIEEYRILTSSNSTNGQDGTWEEVVHETGNRFSARTHTFDFTGKSWVKMEIIIAHYSEDFYQYGLEDPSIGEIELFDVSAGQDDSWFIIGNSLTAGAFKGLGYVEGEVFEDIIETNTGGTNRPMVLRGGIPCIHSYEVADVLDLYYNLGSDAKYWAILLGTNDAMGGSNSGVSRFKTSMQKIIDYAKSKGKIPVLAQIPAVNSSITGWQIHPDYLTAVEELISDNNILAGPDFYTEYLAHPEYFNTSDGVHYNDDGSKKMQAMWAECALDLIYNGDKPMISNISVNPEVINNASNTNLTISATVTTNTGTIQSVTADLSSLGGGANVVMTKNGNVYSYTYQVAAGTSAGDKSISITAVNSGNKSRTEMTSVEVIDQSNVYPEISNLTVNPGTVSSEENTQIEISATVTDVLGSIQSVSLNLSSVGGGSTVAMTKNGNVYSYQYTVPSGLSAGSKNIVLTAMNAGGNSSTDNVSLLVREPIENELVIYRDNETHVTGSWVSTGRGTISEVSGGAFEGNNHYQWNYIVDGWWGNIGLVLDNANGMDISGYESIKLACRTTGNAKITIRFRDTNNDATGSVDLNTGSSYGYVTLPLSNFTGADLTDVMDIIIDAGGNVQSETGSFYIDDITLIPSSSGTIFEVTPSSITLDATQGSQGNITITSNVSWTASTTASWLSLSTTSGSGNGMITVTTNAVNASSADRTAPVTIQSPGLSDLTVSVTQEWDDILSVETGKDVNIKLYPNPAGSKLYIETLLPADVTIMDIQGSVVKRIKDVSKMDMDVSFLPKGTYIVRLETLENVFIRKIVKK